LSRHLRIIALLIIALLFALINSCKEHEKVTPTSGIKNAHQTPCTLQSFGHDYYAANVNLGDDERDIKRILGSPKKKEIKKCDHIPLCATFHFPFGKFELEGEKEGYLFVIGITITAPGYYGPRNTQVGDDIESVLAKFPDEHHSIQNKGRKLYGDSEKIYEKTSSKKRWEEFAYGEATYNDHGGIVEVLYSDGRIGFGSHSLTYKVKKGKVTEIRLYEQNV
jgi:hypothetical protein